MMMMMMVIIIIIIIRKCFGLMKLFKFYFLQDLSLV